MFDDDAGNDANDWGNFYVNPEWIITNLADNFFQNYIIVVPIRKIKICIFSRNDLIIRPSDVFNLDLKAP